MVIQKTKVILSTEKLQIHVQRLNFIVPPSNNDVIEELDHLEVVSRQKCDEIRNTLLEEENNQKEKYKMNKEKVRNFEFLTFAFQRTLVLRIVF